MQEILDKLQALVGHPVPQELLDVLTAYPRELRAQAEAMGFAPYEQALYPDLETVLAGNESVREEDIWTEEGPWPQGYLDIGADIGGDHYALVLHESPPRVHALNHETGRFAPLTATLGEFVAGLCRRARGEVRLFKDAFPNRPPR